MKIRNWMENEDSLTVPEKTTEINERFPKTEFPWKATLQRMRFTNAQWWGGRIFWYQLRWDWTSVLPTVAVESSSTLINAPYVSAE